MDRLRAFAPARSLAVGQPQFSCAAAGSVRGVAVLEEFGCDLFIIIF